MFTELIKSFLRIPFHLAETLIRFLLGGKLTFPPLGSETIDFDDISLARMWLKDRKRYEDQSIVMEFENKFSNWNGSESAFAYMGGRNALSACIYGLGLVKGDEVIIPGYTCVVVPNAFHFAGIKTIFCDIELDTYGLDASLIEGKITKKTKAILLHHLYGLVSRDYEKIIAIAHINNLKVIEDCAQSAGAMYKGKKVGNFGDVAFYSCEQSKVLNTIMGGVATTNNPEIAIRMREYYDNSPLPDEKAIEKQLHNIINNYFIYKHPYRWLIADVIRLLNINNQWMSITKDELSGVRPNSYGARMPGPIASIGINQLKKIDSYNESRRKMAKKWDDWCLKEGYVIPVVIPDSVPVFLRYPVLVEERKKMDISWASKQLGVKLGLWFISNAHPSELPVSGCPNANIAVKQCVNFPTSN